MGVWDAVATAGFGFGVTGMRAPGPGGTVIATMPDRPTGGSDLPATLGMPRRDLAMILTDRARSAGVNVRLGVELDEVDEHDDLVTVTFDDGSSADYNVVIGADGVHSGVRERIGITEKPEPTGMAIWRVFTPRPAGIDHTDLSCGVLPTSRATARPVTTRCTPTSSKRRIAPISI